MQLQLYQKFESINLLLMTAVGHELFHYYISQYPFTKLFFILRFGSVHVVKVNTSDNNYIKGFATLSVTYKTEHIITE